MQKRDIEEKSCQIPNLIMMHENDGVPAHSPGCRDFQSRCCARNLKNCQVHSPAKAQ
jgi:hypothetical protein